MNMYSTDSEGDEEEEEEGFVEDYFPSSLEQDQENVERMLIEEASGKQQNDGDDKMGIDGIKEGFKTLEGVDETTLNQLINFDPTTVSELDTSTKLMKALTLLTSASSTINSRQSVPKDSTVPKDGTSIELNQAQFSAILELVGSALADVACGMPSNSKNASTSTYALLNARASLELKLSSSGTTLNSQLANPTVPSRNPPPVPIRSKSDTIGTLFADNLRLLTLALDPPFLRTAVSNDTSKGTESSPLKACWINTIPSEILAHILVLARKECEVKGVNGMNPEYDEYSGSLRRERSRHVDSKGNDLMGSKTAAQRWIHSISLVSQHWRSTSLSIAYSSIYLRKRSQFVKLVQVLEDHQTCGDYILRLDAKVASPIDESGMRSRGMGGMNRGAIFIRSWIGTPGIPDATSDRTKKGEKEESQGILFGRIVGSAKNLSRLNLTLLQNAYSLQMGRSGGTTDFLDPIILSTISSILTLESLQLNTALDFEELEFILLGSPSLKFLNLAGGLDNVDGTGVVNATIPHSCQFKSVIIGNGNPRDFTTLTDVQLSWLLEPACDTIEQLEITLMSLTAGGLAGGWGVVVAGQAPAFASSSFADSLMRMRNLERLSLRDVQNSVAVNPSINNHPHNGSFDHALRSLRHLKDLTLQLHLTGPQFLNSLVSPLIQSLVLIGVPTHLSAMDFSDRLEVGSQFPLLERVVISGQFSGRVVANGGVQLGGGGWSGKDVRHLKAIAAEKEISFIFSTQS